VATEATLTSKLKRLIAEDPRTAILLIEILGPPLGLAAPASASEPTDMSPKKGPSAE